MHCGQSTQTQSHVARPTPPVNPAAVEMLYAMMEAHDPDAAAHMRRVGELAAQIGQQLGLGDDQIRQLYWGGLLHDIGRLAISAPGSATPTTRSLHEAHQITRLPIVGAQIARLIAGAAAISPIIRQHQERLDGSGYPDGLIGAEIPLLARIVAVADSFDARSTPRPYQVLLTPEATLAQLHSEAGQLWDVAVVQALAAVIAPEPLAERAVGDWLAA